MKISEVPEKHWMLLNNNREVLYHSEFVGDVVRKGREYPLGDVSIEQKFTGLLAFLLSSVDKEKLYIPISTLGNKAKQI